MNSAHSPHRSHLSSAKCSKKTVEMGTTKLYSQEITISSSRSSNFYKFTNRILIIACSIALLCLWVMGTILTVQIDTDSREKLIAYGFFDERVQNLTKNVDNFCARKERQRLLKSDVRRLLKEEESGESEVNLKKRERALRNSLIYIKDLDQMWCLLPKAASTAWGNLIIQRLSDEGHATGGFINNGTVPPQVRLRETYRRVSSEVYANAIHSDNVQKILLVRHPFARLVSAFKNKLEDRKAKMDSMFFFRSYGVKIKRKYRQKNDIFKPKRKEPTFEEFVEYLIATDPLDYDEHWQPISLQCGLCEVKYDHIIRQEDLALMNGYHLKKLGFPDYGTLSMENSEAGGLNYTSFYERIPRRKMIHLFLKFRDDFHLFGYKFFDYFLAPSLT